MLDWDMSRYNTQCSSKINELKLTNGVRVLSGDGRLLFSNRAVDV